MKKLKDIFRAIWAGYRERRQLAKSRNAQRIFQRHFKKNRWGNTESVSGPGSTIAYTENIRKEIPQLVAELKVRTILDAPCGDFNWFRMIHWMTPVTYIGGDIVPPLVARNQSMYGNPETRFITLDIVQDALPAVDLWLCRDCLFHLSNRDISRVIDNFLRSDIRYLLTSTHSACTQNTDIPTGKFRLLNLQLPPFSFCQPTRLIDDWVAGVPVRHLALWERETLRTSLRRSSPGTFPQP